MGRRFGFNAGHIAVSLSDGVDESMKAAVKNAEKIATKITHKFAGDIVKRAKAKWPVKTGLSKKALRSRDSNLESVILDDAKKRSKARGRVKNVEYAYAINKGVTWATLVQEPVANAQSAFADEIATEIAKSIGS